MNREEEEERRRCVTEAMHRIPLDMDYHDGFVVLTILYDIGWFHLYSLQHEEREQDPEYSDYPLDCEYDFQDDYNIKTDSFGRITYLHVPITDDERGGDDVVYYDLPPGVSHLHKLQEIRLSGCRQIPVELGDLPCLTEIDIFISDRDLFDNIPVGLQLPQVTCVRVESCTFPRSWIPFLNLLPNCLKELHFNECLDQDEATTLMKTSEAKTLISALQNRELKFYQSLTTLRIEAAKVDDDGFEKLLFEVLPRFPNLQNLILERCDIKSLCGAEKKIKELGVVSDTKLTKLDLHWNPVFSKGLVVSSECEFTTTKLKEIDSKTLSDEKSAALLFLNTFDTISNLGAMLDDQYDPDIEGALRNNLMKRPFTDEGIVGTWPSNAALWPFMLEKVYNNSWKVYKGKFNRWTAKDDKYEIDRVKQESKMKKKCATELFHMVRYGPIFSVDRCPQHEITTAPATKKQRTKK